MKNKIRAAAYPAMNSEEINAVTVLRSVLDARIVKPDITEHDKIPNIDGYLVLTDMEQYPVGKLEIQVKKLSRANCSKPKYQIGLPFIAYCQDVAGLPVLLVVVDTDNNCAYWKHFSKPLSIGLLAKARGKTISITFDQEQVIRKGDEKHYLEWLRIAKDHQNRLSNYEVVNEKLEESLVTISELTKLTNEAVGTEDDNYVYIHKFLDVYNGLLDYQFNTIKKVLYPSVWKIGMAYVNFTPTEIDFLLYSVDYKLNDSLIKKIDFERAKGLINQFGFTSSLQNRIISEPISTAYGMIFEKLKKVVEGKQICLINDFLAHEYISAFYQCYNRLISVNINEGEEVTLQKLDFLLFEKWTYALFNHIYHDLPESFFENSEIIPLNIDVLNNLTLRDKRQLVRSLKNDSISNNYKRYKSKIVMTSSHFDLPYLKRLIDFLISKGLNKATQPFLKRDLENSAGLRWGGFSRNVMFENVKTMVSNLILTYDDFIEHYFSQLYTSLRFRENYDLVIFTLDEFESSINRPPLITFYKFKRITGRRSDFIVLFFLTEDVPFDVNNIFKETFSYENCEYELKAMQGINFRMLFERTPVYCLLYEYVMERFNRYFKDKEVNVNRFIYY